MKFFQVFVFVCQSKFHHLIVICKLLWRKNIFIMIVIILLVTQKVQFGCEFRALLLGIWKEISLGTCFFRVVFETFKWLSNFSC